MSSIGSSIDLGLQHYRAGNRAEAESVFRAILARDPNHAEALHLLGVLAADADQPDLAIDLIRRAIAIRPDVAGYHSNLGSALRDAGRLDEAVESCRRAIAINPRHAKAHFNLGQSMRDLDRIDEAIAMFEQAIALDPNYARAHYALGLMLLLKGELARGFGEYEWRWRRDNFRSPKRNFTQSQWDGSAMPDKTVLLHAEQGLGDALQFVRYAPQVAQRVGSVIVECQAPLVRLFKTVGGVSDVIANGESLPPFDLHLPMLSLPLAMGTTRIEQIPRHVPYLRADEHDVAAWAQRIADVHGRFKVGLVWAGNPQHQFDHLRSIAIEKLAPLAAGKDVSLISLQKDRPADATSPPFELIDHTSELRDFADTAALIANLDLVISVDTSVAHLAGAIGKPVWTLLASSPDWRWMLDREDSPWYPSMGLFRQRVRGDWDEVISRVAAALIERASQERS
jgi:lipoprotein NlpI